VAAVIRPSNPINPEVFAMRAKFSVSLATTIILMLPAPLLAGGPPRLCLPVDGVTAGTANDCAERIAGALGKRAEGKVVLRENDKQWYVLFHFNCEQVTLAELDQALKGSRFSIPRDKLRLFGHVMLEVKIDPAAEQKLLADLKQVKHLTIEESKRNDGVLYVTAVMPYPAARARDTEGFASRPISDERFGAEPSDLAPRTTTPARAQDLPNYDGLRKIAEKHGGTLESIRWKCWACRVLGGVAATPSAERPR
jgi:hypothetical protein